MAARGKVGEAFVEVVGDYTRFVKESEKKINAFFKSISGSIQFDDMGRASENAGEQAGRQWSEGFERQVRRTRGERFRTARDDGRNFIARFLGGTREETNRRGGFLSRLFVGVGQGIVQSLALGVAAAGGIVGSLFGKGAEAAGGIIGIGDQIAGALPVIGPLLAGLAKLTAIGLLVPILHSVGSAVYFLAGNLFLLPGALAAVGIPLLTLTVAFSGFGEAVAALASGDLEKIEEALKDLPPAMQAVAREVAGVLLPALQRIRTEIQQRFFQQVEGDATKLAKRLGPLFQQGLGVLSGTLGRLASALVDKLTSPQGQKFFANLLATVNRIAADFGPKLLNFFGTLGRVFEASLPYVEMLFRLLGKGLEYFGGWIDDQVTEGKFQDFLLSALETLKDLIFFVIALIDVFRALFQDTEEGGQTFLQYMTEALRGLAQWLRSPDGRAAIRALIALAKLLFKAIVVATGAILSMLSALGRVYRAARDAYNMIKALVNFAFNNLSGVGAAVGSAVGRIPGFAVGGIVERPTLATVGEAGPEAIIPLNNPGRARELLEDAGLVSLAAGMNTDGGDVTVVVYLGTDQITEILDMRVEKGLNKAAKSIKQGSRPD